jgi:mono/diheme cytochrome c family protein
MRNVVNTIRAASALVAVMSLRTRGAEPIDFAHDVLPLLSQHCAQCHASGRYEGEVSFDTREALVASGVATPGDAAGSALIDRVTSEDPDYRMPPEGSALSAEEIATLRRWIDADLPWEPGFSFKQSAYEAPLAPRRPELPPAPAEATHPIDRLVAAYWREHGVKPPPLADDAVFCRRVYLDLIGLLPTEAELSDFIADRDPERRAALVDRLLNRRVDYADHWVSFWNDLLRNDYAGAGYIDGGRKQITRWLYQALVDNMPYDEFVQTLVAPPAEAEGFAKGIVWRGQVNASQTPALQYAQNVGQVFLGMNLKCASCHDSFVDRWKLADAYGLAAIAHDGPLELYRCDKPTGERAEPQFLFPELGQVDAQAPRAARMRQLAALITHPQNGRLTRTVVNRLWHRLMGRGIVHPVDAMDSPPWSDDVLDYLAVHLADSGYDLKATLRLIATSRAYASQTVGWDEASPADEYVFTGPIAKRVTAEQFVDAIARLTGAAPDKTDDDEIFVKCVGAEGDGAGRPFVRASIVEGTLLTRTLGRPNREQVASTRPTELTTLEALELSNGEPLADLLRAGAAKMIEQHGGESSGEVCAEAFRVALSREPSDDELAELAAMAGEPLTVDGLADVLWTIVMLPEFQLVR